MHGARCGARHHGRLYLRETLGKSDGDGATERMAVKFLSNCNTYHFTIDTALFAGMDYSNLPPTADP